MVNTATTTSPLRAETPTRVQIVWQLVTQSTALAVTLFALVWTPAPLRPLQMLLGLLTLASVGVAVLPIWRGGEVARIIGGLVLVTVCWLAADAHSWQLNLGDTNIFTLPAPALLVLVLAVPLAVWGFLVMRADAAYQVCFGVAAVAAALLLCFMAALLFAGVNYLPTLGHMYMIETYQVVELAIPAIGYGLAIWLGGAGLHPANRWPIVSYGQAIVLVVFLCFWHLHH